jgi:hypothetical protein
MNTQQELEQKLKVQAERSFQAWMENPTNRLLISTIPADDHKDTLFVLLRSAFDYGYGTGQANVAMMMLEGMIRKREP